MSNKPPIYHVKKIIEFNPAWLDENGLMTNVPGPDFLSSLNLPEGANVAIGVYPSTRSFKGRRPDDEELLHFKITHACVEQELRFDEKALIFNSQLIVESISSHTRNAIWEPFFTPEGKKVWCVCGETRFHRVEQSAELVPATMAALFFQLDMRLRRTWDSLKKSEYSDKSWTFRLHQTALRKPNLPSTRLDPLALEDGWKARPTGERERTLWLAVMGYTTGVLSDPHPNKALRTEREEQLLHFVDQALTLKDVL